MLAQDSAAQATLGVDLASSPWYKADGAFDCTAVAAFLGCLTNMPANAPKRFVNVKVQLGRILAVLRAVTHEERRALLLKQEVDGSLGVMLAGFAADPANTMSASGVFPPSRVQCDVRGSIAVGGLSDDSKCCTVSP